ncbi:MAG: type II toxin-antitoxin system Phd/YefM family antitoxin [Candidatus Taylorbacteria bacterium]|nr:type II toxin-antitoxin system Phd/YefM family antitoxin [Candidatus Taylorbacteria bacterium]
MKIVTTTNARKNISAIIDRVKYHGEVFGIGRRDSIDAVVLKFPEMYNSAVNDITNINAYSKSFDFLKGEPDLYSLSDLKKKYA